VKRRVLSISVTEDKCKIKKPTCNEANCNRYAKLGIN
jgi:hypothetical protein